MGTGIWEHNSEILRRQYPGLLDAIAGIDNDDELTIETAVSGEPTLSINGLYIHSPRDPRREGKRLAQAGLPQDGAPVIVLGFGLGYAAQELAELAPQCPVIIVEKKLSVLRKACELRDLSSLFSRPNIAIVPGGDGDGVITALSFFHAQLSGGTSRSAPHIIRNRALTNIDEQWYNAVEHRIFTWAMRDDVNKATLRKFGRRWIRNLTRNMDSIRDIPGISRLAGLAAGQEPIPVFLAAAGPSLDNIAVLLPEIHRRCIIVAVDTSLRFLLRNGIHPDFTLVVDPQFWNSRHLDRCESRHTHLIVESAAYPPVLRLPFKGMFLCGSLFPLGQFIEERVDPKGALGTGGSVATAAWDFCRMLGAGEIWIAGLDLAFPGLRTHYRGALFDEKVHAESGRFTPAETTISAALRGGNPIHVPSFSGQTVLSDRRLSLYASWFENSFCRFPAIRNYSLFPAELPLHTGQAIAGLEPANPQMLSALSPRRADIDKRLETALSRIKAEFYEAGETQHRRDRYEDAVHKLHTGLAAIQDACAQGQEIADRALRQQLNKTEQEKTLAALDAVNSTITGSDVKDIAAFLFPPEFAETNSTVSNFENYLRSSVRLYRSLALAVNDSATA